MWFQGHSQKCLLVWLVMWSYVHEKISYHLCLSLQGMHLNVVDCEASWCMKNIWNKTILKWEVTANCLDKNGTCHSCHQIDYDIGNMLEFLCKNNDGIYTLNWKIGFQTSSEGTNMNKKKIIRIRIFDIHMCFCSLFVNFSVQEQLGQDFFSCTFILEFFIGMNTCSSILYYLKMIHMPDPRQHVACWLC